jgi:hypothetical protein
MSEDPRCCGTGTCIINADGLCWCGQRWDGEKMSFSKPASSSSEAGNTPRMQDAHDASDASGDNSA